MGDLVVDLILQDLGIPYDSSYSIVQSVEQLFAEGNWFLGGLIALFSLIFPLYKIFKFTQLFWRREASSPLFTQLSLWSLLDVFVISILVVSCKSMGGTKIEPGIGIYLFGLSIIFLFFAIKFNQCEVSHFSSDPGSPEDDGRIPIPHRP